MQLVEACLPVFSAHAEVVPTKIAFHPGFGSILRARGGSSQAGSVSPVCLRYSPRTRR